MKNFRVLFYFVFVLFFLASCEKSEEVENQTIAMKKEIIDDNLNAEISFKINQDFNYIQSLLDNNDLRIIYLETRSNIGDETITEFTNTFSSNSVADIENEFQRKFQKMKEVIPKNLLSYQNRRAAELRYQLEQSSNEKIERRVSKIIVGNISKDKIDQIEKRLPIGGYEIKVMDKEEMEKEYLLNNDFNSKELNQKDWVPEYSYSEAYQFDDLHRYSFNGMLWEEPFESDISTNLEVYEHDYYLNAYPSSQDGAGIYFTKEEVGFFQPKISYGVSTLPDLYLDTRLQDPDEIISFTVGSGNPTNIVTNAWNYTFLVLENGDANKDRGSLQAQLLKRTVSFCHPNTCAFLQDSEWISPEYQNTHWSIEIPGDKFMSN